MSPMAAIKRHFCFMLNRSGKFNSNFCRNWNRPKSGGLVAAGKLRAVSVTSQEKGLFLIYETAEVSAGGYSKNSR
jgi:hypothetical protein